MLEKVQDQVPVNYEEEEDLEWVGDCEEDSEGNLNEEPPAPQRVPRFIEIIRNDHELSLTFPDLPDVTAGKLILFLYCTLKNFFFLISTFNYNFYSVLLRNL